MALKDVQGTRDTRGIYINQVGIKDMVCPMEIKNGEGEWVPVTATVSVFCDLAPELKGTHMSRFVEVIQENSRMDLAHMKSILEGIQKKLETQASFVHIAFDYFVWKKAPVTERDSYLNVKVEYTASLQHGDFEFQLTVRTPVTTLCPCSKEISAYSAHNQRATVSLMVRTDKFVWIEDLVRIAEESASAPVYTLLKRPDEKFVTEQAYDHPQFVEDVARDAKLKMDQIDGVRQYEIEVESHESIHNHVAYARIVRP